MKCMSFGSKHNYMHDRIGFNYRMTNGQAKLILQSLENVDKNIEIRRQNADLYDSILNANYHMPKRDVPWVYDIKVEKNDIVDVLNKKGIDARYGFKPVSTCEPFRSNKNIKNSKYYSERIMYLPVMCTEDQLKNNIKELVKLL